MSVPGLARSRSRRRHGDARITNEPPALMTPRCYPQARSENVPPARGTEERYWLDVARFGSMTSFPFGWRTHRVPDESVKVILHRTAMSDVRAALSTKDTTGPRMGFVCG